MTQESDIVLTPRLIIKREQRNRGISATIRVGCSKIGAPILPCIPSSPFEAE